MLSFIPFTNDEKAIRYVSRKGETKIGDTILCCNENLAESIKTQRPDFVIIGIPEGFGPVANYGKPGAEKGWECFLPAFLSMQDNQFYTAKKVMIAGTIDTSALQNKADKLLQAGAPPESFRPLVEQLDEIVFTVLKIVFESGAVPVIIGGGHNNAYPVIKAATAVNLDSKINIVNIDPHADFRAMEGRHSGNPFSYAMHRGMINQYFVAGLHKAYNSEKMLSELNSMPEKTGFTMLEGNFDTENTCEVVQSFFGKSTYPVGLEFDTDSIVNFPVSALTPFGISVNKAVEIIHCFTKHLKPVYLHLPEAAPGENKNDEIITGKVLALLVHTFLAAKD